MDWPWIEKRTRIQDTQDKGWIALGHQGGCVTYPPLCGFPKELCLEKASVSSRPQAPEIAKALAMSESEL